VILARQAAVKPQFLVAACVGFSSTIPVSAQEMRPDGVE